MLSFLELLIQLVFWKLNYSNFDLHLSQTNIIINLSCNFNEISIVPRKLHPKAAQMEWFLSSVENNILLPKIDSSLME